MLNKITIFLINIVNKGYNKDDAENSDKSIIITNFVMLLASSLAFARFLFFFSIKDYTYSLVSLASSISFFSLYLANSHGYHDFAKFSLMIIGNLATGYKELMSGGTAGQIYLILASFGVVFLLFDVKNKLKLFFALLIPFTNTIINLAFPNLLHAPLYVSPSEALYEKVIGVFSNVIISVFIIWYFVKKSNEIELKLKENNKQLNRINDDLQTQKEIIESKNEEIYASIRYAERIQKTILPWESSLVEAFKEYFIISKPKDIVSGDFYWLHKNEKATYFAVGDCTGHGVSGSMLSMIGITVLDEAVFLNENPNPNEMLKYSDYKLTNALNQQLEENNSRDSIEISLIKIQNNKLYFSGARLNLFLFQNNELKIIKGSRVSIGGDTILGNEYTHFETEIKENTLVYLMSDGYVDQMGINGKKFGSKQLVNTLNSICHLPLTEQKSILEDKFEEHKGNEAQRDDVTLIAFRIK